MPALADITNDRTSCLPKEREPFLPAISSNRGSQSSNYADTEHNRDDTQANTYGDMLQQQSLINSSMFNEKLRLPTIDRSKTTSISSLNGLFGNSKLRKTCSFRSTGNADISRSPSCPNFTDFDASLNDTKFAAISPLSITDEVQATSDYRISTPIKLPTIPKKNDILSKKTVNLNNNAKLGGGCTTSLVSSNNANDLRQVLNSSINHQCISTKQTPGFYSDKILPKSKQTFQKTESFESPQYIKSNNRIPLLVPIHNTENDNRQKQKHTFSKIKSLQNNGISSSKTSHHSKSNKQNCYDVHDVECAKDIASRASNYGGFSSRRSSLNSSTVSQHRQKSNITNTRPDNNVKKK